MDSAPSADHSTRPGRGAAMNRRALAREPWLWAFVGAWAVFVSALHFGGLAYDVYTKIWWWDLLTHSLSGFGVAGVLFLVFPRTFHGRRAPFLVAGVVLAIGAGFEVYEYLFKDFWYGWSATYYAEDTAIDLVVDVVGALGFVALVEAFVRRRPPVTASSGGDGARANGDGGRALWSDGGRSPGREPRADSVVDDGKTDR